MQRSVSWTSGQDASTCADGMQMRAEMALLHARLKRLQDDVAAQQRWRGMEEQRVRDMVNQHLALDRDDDDCPLRQACDALVLRAVWHHAGTARYDVYIITALHVLPFFALRTSSVFAQV